MWLYCTLQWFDVPPGPETSLCSCVDISDRSYFIVSPYSGIYFFNYSPKYFRRIDKGFSFRGEETWFWTLTNLHVSSRGETRSPPRRPCAMKRPCEDSSSAESDVEETIDVGSESIYPGWVSSSCSLMKSSSGWWLNVFIINNYYINYKFKGAEFDF